MPILAGSVLRHTAVEMRGREGNIYLYGMTLVTTCHRLADDFPAADHYGEIRESHRMPGGESGTCAVVLSGLGLSVELDGNFQGWRTYPELCEFFANTSVSLELVTHDRDFEGLEDIVFVDDRTRTPFGRFREFYADGSPRRWNSADEDAVRQAAAVGIDPFFAEESVNAARLCAGHAVRFATIDCRLDSEIHALAAVNVLSHEFLRDQHPGEELDALFVEYTNRTDGLVVFTFGSDELWYGRAGGGKQSFAPYQVEVQSTLGAGDSFKAGVIYGLANAMDDATLVHFASATAAAACISFPIASNPPTLELISEIAGESFGGPDAP